jgi:hypothetical protein
MKGSTGSIALYSFNSALKTQNSALAVVAAVSGYTGLWAGGSRHRDNNRAVVCLCCWNGSVPGLASLKALM